MHFDAKGTTNCRTWAEVHVCAAQNAPCGGDRRPWIAVDARRPRRFTCRVHDPDVVTNDESSLQNRQEEEDDERKDECELDRGLSPFPETGHRPRPPKQTAH